jgi:hypothetical protein
MTDNQPVADFIQKLGFTGIPEVEQMLDEFYQQFGGFAITLYFNTNIGSSSLYVNISTGDNNAAINAGLVQTITAAYGSHSNGVFVSAGQTISCTIDEISECIPVGGF